MDLVIRINTDNAAFEEPSFEVARILREYADHVEGGGGFDKNLMDANGNRVGSAGDESVEAQASAQEYGSRDDEEERDWRERASEGDPTAVAQAENESLDEAKKKKKFPFWLKFKKGGKDKDAKGKDSKKDESVDAQGLVDKLLG